MASSFAAQIESLLAALRHAFSPESYACSALVKHLYLVTFADIHILHFVFVETATVLMLPEQARLCPQHICSTCATAQRASTDMRRAKSHSMQKHPGLHAHTQRSWVSAMARHLLAATYVGGFCCWKRHI